MLSFNKNKILILNFFLILFGALFLNILIDKNRYLIKNPDDFFHYLTKSTLIKNCKSTDKNQCAGIKRISKLNYKNFDIEKKLNLERQKHRLITSYHPLYTFLLAKFSANEDVFLSQKNFHYLLSIILSIMILYYLKFFIKNDKYISLIIVIYISHFFLKGGYGLHFAMPATLTAFLSGLSIIFLYKKKKLISYFFILLSITTHHVGILFCLSNLSAFKIYELISLKEKKNFLNKKNFVEILIFFFLIIASFFLKYNIFKEINASFNVYEIDYKNLDFLHVMFNNFLMLSKNFIFSILLINSLIIYFFYKNFLKKDNGEILFLKIIFLSSLIFSIFTPIGSSDSAITFVFGNRFWEIFILNFLILGIFQLSILKSKKEIFLKKIFIFTLPLFILFNLLLLKDRTQYIINYDDYFLPKSNLIQFTKNININDKITLDLNETNFYYLLNTGLIKNDFFIKDFSSDSEIKKTDFLIIDNPIKLLRRSSLFLKNDDVIQINKKHDYLELHLYSLISQEILINDEIFILKEGLNNLKIGKNLLKFGEINRKIYLIGIKVEESQKNFWPWYTDFQFSLNTTISTWKLFLDKKIPHKKDFVFSELSKSVSNKKNDNCKNVILSDIGSVLILKNNCK